MVPVHVARRFLFFYAAIVNAEHLKDERETMAYFTNGAREKLCKKLSPSYLACVLCTTTTTSVQRVGKLRLSSLTATNDPLVCSPFRETTMSLSYCIKQQATRNRVNSIYSKKPRVELNLEILHYNWA